MIAKLSGVVDSAGDGWAVIDVGGVGYLVLCSSRTLSRLAVGSFARVLVVTHLRETELQLFGFADAGERQWFRLLTTVQGVGNKVALSLLSSLAPDELALAIASGDRGLLTRAAGVGAKLAGRIVSELRERAVALGPLPTAGGPAVGGGAASGADEAVAALLGLGFRPGEALTAVSEAARKLGQNAGVEALIRDGLARLAPPEHAR
jgi:Holliday junction DNA helicase RuvA